MLARLFALLATGEVSLVKRRVKLGAIAYGLMAILGLLALIFLVLAAYLAAAVNWGAIQAAIWFAVGFFLLTVVISVVYKIVDRRQRRVQQRKRSADTGMLAGASAVAMLPALISKKGGFAALFLTLAGIAGYAAYRELGSHDDEEPGS